MPQKTGRRRRNNTRTGGTPIIVHAFNPVTWRLPPSSPSSLPPLRPFKRPSFARRGAHCSITNFRPRPRAHHPPSLFTRATKIMRPPTNQSIRRHLFDCSLTSAYPRTRLPGRCSSPPSTPLLVCSRPTGSQLHTTYTRTCADVYARNPNLRRSVTLFSRWKREKKGRGRRKEEFTRKINNPSLEEERTSEGINERAPSNG